MPCGDENYNKIFIIATPPLSLRAKQQLTAHGREDSMAGRALVILVTSVVGTVLPMSILCPCRHEAGFKCPALSADGCEMVRDECDCCDVCSRDRGESCGAEAPRCASGLVCRHPECRKFVQVQGGIIPAWCFTLPMGQSGTCLPEGIGDFLNLKANSLTSHHPGTASKCGPYPFWCPRVQFDRISRCHVCAEKWNHVDKANKDSFKHGDCSFEGLVIADGSYEKINDCTRCSCNDGKLHCSSMQCFYSQDCAEVERIPGQCCAACKGPQEGAHAFQGSKRVYARRQINSLARSSCRFGEREIPEGMWVAVGPCEQCYCSDGFLSCMVVSCPTTSCANPVYVSGVCCPVCLPDSADSTLPDAITG